MSGTQVAVIEGLHWLHANSIASKDVSLLHGVATGVHKIQQQMNLAIEQVRSNTLP